MMVMGFALALAAGIFIALQGNINALVAGQTGIYTVVLIPVVTQVILLAAFLAVNRSYVQEVARIGQVNWGLALLVASALLGLGIMTTMTFSIMTIGPLVAFTTVIFSQLLASMVIEHFGLIGVAQSPVSVFRILGLGLMVVAVRLFYL